MAAKQSGKGPKLGLPVTAEILSGIVKTPEFQEIVDEIVALSDEERVGFVENNLGKDGLTKRGIKPRGVRMHFKPYDKTKAKEGAKTNKMMRLDILIPDVGILSVRRRY